MCNPHVDLVSINDEGIVRVRCKKCHKLFEDSIQRIIRGFGCIECNIKPKCRRKSIEEVITQMKYCNSKVEIVKYDIPKSTFRCKNNGCNYTWEARLADVLKGSKCKKCSGTLRKTTEQFKKELREVNKDILVMSEYLNTTTKVKCKCLIDGNEWYAQPQHLLHGSRCPVCTHNKRVSVEEMNERIKERFPNIQIVGEYTNTYSKARFMCSIHKYEWKAVPSRLLVSALGCPKCVPNSTKDHEYIVNKIKEVNDRIEITTKYVDSKTKLGCRCKVCGNEWENLPNALMFGNGCPNCRASKGERYIRMYLDEKNIKYTPQKKFEDLRSEQGRMLSYDYLIEIEKHKIVVEFNGKQHYMYIESADGRYSESKYDLEKRKKLDRIKKEYALDNGIHYIEIPYFMVSKEYVYDVLEIALNKIKTNNCELEVIKRSTIERLIKRVESNKGSSNVKARDLFE